MTLHIVLVEPEIPSNTGNIARTCAATGIWLHLVRPLGFSTDDRALKRAGLDYWHAVHVEYHDSFQEIVSQYPNRRFMLATTKATRNYADFNYGADDFFVFGKESAGLPREMLDQYSETLIRVPMGSPVRSLNLANTAAIVVYEALRQLGFPEMS